MCVVQVVRYCTVSNTMNPAVMVWQLLFHCWQFLFHAGTGSLSTQSATLSSQTSLDSPDFNKYSFTIFLKLSDCPLMP